MSCVCSECCALQARLSSAAVPGELHRRRGIGQHRGANTLVGWGQQDPCPAVPFHPCLLGHVSYLCRPPPPLPPCSSVGFVRLLLSTFLFLCCFPLLLCSHIPVSCLCLSPVCVLFVCLPACLSVCFCFSLSLSLCLV